MSNYRKRPRYADESDPPSRYSRSQSSASSRKDQRSTPIKREATFTDELLNRIEQLEKSQRETEKVAKLQKDDLMILEARVKIQKDDFQILNTKAEEQKKEIVDLRMELAAEKNARKSECEKLWNESKKQKSQLLQAIKQQDDLVQDMQERKRRSDINTTRNYMAELIDVFVTFEGNGTKKYTVKKGTTFADIRKTVAEQNGVDPIKLEIKGLEGNDLLYKARAGASYFVSRHTKRTLPGPSREDFRRNPAARFIISSSPTVIWEKW